MSPAFFVGKRALLKWINDFFKLPYSKVEQCASGALHCQVLDCLFPGQVPLHKVNFNAQHSYEFVKNYKILQKVFDEQQINKHVDVQKLLKAKYQDNLEFLQWIKHLFDVRYAGQPYDAEARRKEAMKRYSKGHKLRSAKMGRASSSRSPAPAPARNPKRKPAPAAAAAKPQAEHKASAAPRGGRAPKPRPAAAAGQVLELREALTATTKERNFYLDKLREVEVLCTSREQCASAEILAILYKTDEAGEFEQPPLDGEEGDDDAMV